MRPCHPIPMNAGRAGGRVRLDYDGRMAMPQVGDEAPDFDLPVSGSGRVRLADLRGRPVVLWFYPRDDTPG